MTLLKFQMMDAADLGREISSATAQLLPGPETTLVLAFLFYFSRVIMYSLNCARAKWTLRSVSLSGKSRKNGKS